LDELHHQQRWFLNENLVFGQYLLAGHEKLHMRQGLGA
jgi:hypothetical protein